jgi:hypothetical protein
MGTEVLWTAHTGDEIPVGTRPLGNLPEQVESIRTEGTGAVVSLLHNGRDRYLVIVNRDFLKPMKLAASFKTDVKRIMKDGSEMYCEKNNNNLEIEPGDLIIFNWKE